MNKREFRHSLFCKVYNHRLCGVSKCECRCHGKIVLMTTRITESKHDAINQTGFEIWQSGIHNMPVGEARFKLFKSLLKETTFDFTDDEISAFSAAVSSLEPSTWSLYDFRKAYEAEEQNIIQSQETLF